MVRRRSRVRFPLSAYRRKPSVSSFCLREGKVRIICELARKISERAREREKLAKRVSHRLREGKKLSHIGKYRRKLYENIDFCRTNGTIENELLCLETDLKE